MNTHIVEESNWESFIEKEIFPLMAKNTNEKNNCILALVGNLGAGKTTFAKTFFKKIGVQETISSPTFSIINSYPVIYNNFTNSNHIDVYRIENLNELDTIHFDEIIQKENTVSLIEWADTIKKKIPTHAVWIYFEHNTLETRKVMIGS
jgi:tRNA threonylcarbamoyladenosine biosynthesis protein TsaE